MKRLSSRQWLWGLLALAVVVRLLTLGMYPLTDTTEARYGEMARKMLETGQWIVPQIDYGVPFLGKPPLSFWLTALSYKMLGVSEFAARLPSLLLGITTCALVYVVALPRGRDHALRATVVVATTALMMACAGAVMTDPAMMLGTTLAMVAFWRARANGSRGWGYAFFAGLTIGLLAKGPIATVLSFMPIGAWALFTGRWRQLHRALPWASGTALALLLVVPWYWFAERQSPGFLHYFIVGEHWQRFTVSGWKGDLYGTAHARPIGTIWIYALVATLPWSPWVVWRLSRRQGFFSASSLCADDGWLLYLLCWMLAPMLFFTVARNILVPYVLPGLVGFGLLAAEAWQGRVEAGKPDMPAWLGIVAPVFMFVAILWVWPAVGFKSQKEVVAVYDRLEPEERRLPLVYVKQRPYSAEFYSRGKAQKIDLAQLSIRMEMHDIQYFAVDTDVIGRLPEQEKSRLRRVMTLHDGSTVLFRHDPEELRRHAWQAGP